eukprot:TRINITY_DN2863_c0_g1_i1.p1 TRINITY_DN2863_c0_g1~~TRINITY_DN2863_c0_g1_i1.p1  ORF type:complete len:290 (+),score=43.31 TRINITY_DN2863_c0_g1_i1:206-1075(+)
MEEDDPRKAKMEAAMRVIYPPVETTKKLLGIFKNKQQMVYLRACVMVGKGGEDKVAVVVGRCLFYVCSLQGQVLRTLRYDQILGVDIARSLRANVSFECVFLIKGSEPDLYLVFADSKLNKNKSTDVEIHKFFHCIELAKEALNNQPFPINNKRVKELGVDSSHKQQNAIESPNQKLQSARERSMSPNRRSGNLEPTVTKKKSPKRTHADEFTDYTFDVELEKNRIMMARGLDKPRPQSPQNVLPRKPPPCWTPVPPPQSSKPVDKSAAYWLGFVQKWELKADGHMQSF